ncbi:hypothetical protein E4P40_22375 [Blastococcus sp. CT_GayMR20]|uniref:hypothetical protein n=1 Tax=Blastococcus sp. CT_GayMR20 TaxID=2559609 RepID=UPI0010735B99|nr:hypothetical protein [Blastococcus sp. CT_GayMR20]TFV69356.1 hypothetical protein E4P40_22350 [Blastococcus sp. CT_GayMR20]TFV69361.1 hypothetical protein E4P40_22375 [Blastococcus sp. CT_GayMR20]
MTTKVDETGTVTTQVEGLVQPACPSTPAAGSTGTAPAADTTCAAPVTEAAVAPPTAIVSPATECPAPIAPVVTADSADKRSADVPPAAHRSIGASGVDAAPAAPATDITADSTQTSTPTVSSASGDAPLGPTAPLQLPSAPSTTAGGTGGCAGPGAGPGSPKGGPAPTVTAVEGGSDDLYLAVDDAAHTVPATGSLATTTTDPATRPD